MRSNNKVDVLDASVRLDDKKTIRPPAVFQDI